MSMEKVSLVYNGSFFFIGILYFLFVFFVLFFMVQGNFWYWVCKYFFNGVDKILNVLDGNFKEVNNKKFVFYMGCR